MVQKLQDLFLVT